MCRIHTKYGSLLRPLIITALLLFCNHINSQILTLKDSIERITPPATTRINSNSLFRSSSSTSVYPDSIIPTNSDRLDMNRLFLDSLKLRASKNLVTRKLYEFVIIHPPSAESSKNPATSYDSYTTNAGKKIRNIEILRLDVFGSNINDPENPDSKKIESFLNKTHINTHETIIRKNLLFSVGDSVSPLLLSENERILRQLSYINDARIIVVPVTEDEVDIRVLTKDIYSLGASYNYGGFKRGTASIFEKNTLGLGHEFGIEIPFDTSIPGSPGFGMHYIVNNIRRSFINMKLFYLDDLREKSYGLTLRRDLISSSTKYAGGISLIQMHTTDDLDYLPAPEPLRYNFQDYWFLRSFLVDEQSVSRIIFGARYTNNIVYDRPEILPESYHELQRYRLYLGSVALSVQKYYKARMIYSYGPTEDIPYGGLFRLTYGKEYNEFKERSYAGAEIAIGSSNRRFGYFYSSFGLAAFINNSHTEQGILSAKLNYFSNLMTVGKYQVRNFIYVDYTRGFDRYSDEFIMFRKDNGFAGFRNDSITGTQRLSVSLETVLFSPVNFYGFRFAFYGYTDFSFLSGSNEYISTGHNLAAIGVGIRIRNNNLLFNTLQIRLAYYPNPPVYSRINNIIASGEQLLRPDNFEPGPPSVIPYR